MILARVLCHYRSGVKAGQAHYSKMSHVVVLLKLKIPPVFFTSSRKIKKLLLLYILSGLISHNTFHTVDLCRLIGAFCWNRYSVDG